MPDKLQQLQEDLNAGPALNGIINCYADVISQYEAVLRTHYPDDADRLIEATKSLVTEKLRLAGESGLPEFIASLSSSKVHGLLPHAVTLLCANASIHAAWLACEAAETGRSLDLLTFFLQATPSYRTRLFLTRVARCYLLGFDAECVIMCRAALEAELESQIANDDCIDVFGPPEGRDNRAPFSSRERELVAERLGRLSPTALRDAEFVRQAGNKAVHCNPEAGDPLRLIEATIRVLNELSE